MEESKWITSLEDTIRKGQKAWLEVGIALSTIRDEKLFVRLGFETFKAYCLATWNWSDKRAYQLIAAADESSTTGRTFSTEREARESRKERTQAERKPIADKVLTPAPMVDVEDEPPRVTQDDSLLNATGISKERIAEIVSHSEPSVTLYYTELEQLWNVVKANATDKQLNSFSVFAAQLPALIKEEKRNRSTK